MKFIRQAKVQIRFKEKDGSAYKGTITLTGLRVSFSIQKNLSWTCNSGNIRIWNLSQDHRNLINDYGDEVIVYAGYERGSGYEILYRGDTTSVTHVFDFPEIVTILECADGDRYVNQKHFSLSFKPKTPVRDVITRISKEMGIDVAEFANSDNLAYNEGFEFSGMLKEALSKACAVLGLQWSIQNNELQIIPINGALAETVYDINSETGMIGIPTRYTFKRQDFYVKGPAVGYKVNTLLYPQILPGSRLNIVSRYLGIQGIFVVQTIRHVGDTYGPEWISNMEVTELNG
jgi:hypothetical protein